MKHDDIALGHVHLAYNWTYADATAREAATGFVSADVGKLARQLDDDSLWMLAEYSPIAWASVSATIPDSLPPSGTAGGDLGGTYPNPTVNDDSHAHTSTTLPALDELAAPTDITALDVSTAAHGLTPKLPNDNTKYLDGAGAWTVPAGGGGGSGKWYSGTLLVAANGGDYTTIQAAINAAVAGDTIVVSPGVYSENLTVSKRLYIVGLNQGDCIVRGATDDPVIKPTGTDAIGSVIENLQFQTNGSNPVCVACDVSNISTFLFINCTFTGRSNGYILVKMSGNGASNLQFYHCRFAPNANYWGTAIDLTALFVANRATFVHCSGFPRFNADLILEDPVPGLPSATVGNNAELHLHHTDLQNLAVTNASGVVKLYNSRAHGTVTNSGAGAITYYPSLQSLTVEEADGAPSVDNVTTIKVTNGKLTDNGDGSVSLDLSSSGGGGSSDTFTYYDPDKPPTSPNAKDDEFDGAALDAKWTVINPSYLTTYDVNATIPDHLYAKHVADNSPDQLSGFFQSAPASDFTFIAKMGALFGQQNYMRACGIFVGEGTPGQMQCIAFGFEGGPQLRVGHYGTGGNIDAWYYSMATDRHDGYLRFTQVGSTWAWSFSGDGLSWMTFYSGSSQFTIASIGLVFGSYGSLTVKPEITCDWFRVFSGAALVTGGLRSVGVGSGHAIQDEEVPLTTRSSLNFVGAGVTVTDDEANDATIVTIPSGGSAASANIAEHQQMMDTFTGNGATAEFQLTDFGLPGSTRVFVGGTPQRLNVDYWEMPRGYSIKFAAAPANTAVIWVDYRRANGDDLLTLQNPFLIGDATGWTMENGSWSSNTHLLGGCIQGNGSSGQHVGYQTASLRKGLYVVSFSAYSAWGDSPSLHIYDNTRAIQYGSIAAYPGGGAWGRTTARMVLPKTGQYCFRFYQPNNSDRFADLVVARVGDLPPALDFQNAAAIVPNGNFLDDTTGWTLTGANAREAGIPGGILGGCVFNNVNNASKAETDITLETADYAICFSYFNQWGGSANAQIVDAGDNVVWTSGELNGFTNNQWHSLIFVFQGATAGAYKLQLLANSNNHIYYGGIRMSKVSS